MRISFARLMAVSIITAIVPWKPVAEAKEIHAIAVGAMSDVLGDIIPEYERASGHKVIVSFGPSSGSTQRAIPVRIASGEAADVLITVRTALDALIGQGKFTAATRVDFAQSTIGLAVRAGAPKPNINSVEDLRRALLQATSIGYSDGPSGVYIVSELWNKLGIAEQVSKKAKKITDESVGEAVARGDIELGFQQVSELITVNGIDFIGPLPAEVQKATTVVAAVSGSAEDASAARSFVDFLHSEAIALALRKRGFDPVVDAK